MQLAQPSKYNPAYAASQGFDTKYFYKDEKNWGYVANRKADTADQDHDKSRTYDYCRLEYSHIPMILFVDADEFFYCPQAATTIFQQRIYQKEVLGDFVRLGVEEMRFVRIPYSGFISESLFNASSPSRQPLHDSFFNNHTQRCMQAAYMQSDLQAMFRCWSSASSFDAFPKSADLASKCPFHYNHWSCDGGKGGGRDHGTPRCRCKVSFDMFNHLQYKPMLDQCHLLHLNDNKYRFQSRRQKHMHDKGSINSYSPIAELFHKDRSAMIA